MSQKTRILFDGNCVVCDLEISHYKRLAPGSFDLVDISSPEFRAENYQLKSKAVESDLHVITPDGKLKIGVDAFAQIWSQIPRYRFGTSLIKAPGVYQMAKLGYFVFTKVRPYLPKKSKHST